MSYQKKKKLAAFIFFQNLSGLSFSQVKKKRAYCSADFLFSVVFMINRQESRFSSGKKRERSECGKKKEWEKERKSRGRKKITPPLKNVEYKPRVKREGRRKGKKGLN